MNETERKTQRTKINIDRRQSIYQTWENERQIGRTEPGVFTDILGEWIVKQNKIQAIWRETRSHGNIWITLNGRVMGWGSLEHCQNLVNSISHQLGGTDLWTARDDNSASAGTQAPDHDTRDREG